MMYYAVLAARFLLGAPFVFFGLNHFFAWMEPPVEGVPAAALAFLEALRASDYMMPLIGGAQVVGGAMVLSGLFLPLGLLILAPVVLHILLYHLYLAPDGALLAWVLTGLGLFLALAYGKAFHGVLQPMQPSRFRKPGS